MTSISRSPIPEDANDVPEVDYETEGQPTGDNNESTPERDPNEVGNKILMDLIADPDIQNILAARREGRAVRVVDDVETTPKEETADIEDDELEGLDDDMKSIVKILDKQFTARMKPMIDQVAGLESLAKGMQQKAFDEQISTVESKNPDFAKYRTAMAVLSRGEGAGLAVEELFIIAKHRAGALAVVKETTDSVRPTPTPRRKGETTKKDKPQSMSTRKQWQTTLADALDNLDIVRE